MPKRPQARKAKDTRRASDAPPAADLYPLLSAAGDVRMMALAEADRIEKVIRLLTGPEYYVPEAVRHLESASAVIRAFHANAHVL